MTQDSHQLIIMNHKRARAVEYIQRFIGLPYFYGGDDPMQGFDCSGLIHEVLQAVGEERRGFDSTANGLYEQHKDRIITTGYHGCLIFYFRKENSQSFPSRKGMAIHVGMMIDNNFMVHAGGGGSTTRSPEDAIRQNAYVRMDSFLYRPEPHIFCDPFMVRE